MRHLQPRGVDHAVVAVNDLVAAIRTFRNFGFTAGQVGRHPFGTRNAIVQFADRTFVELVAIEDVGQIPDGSAAHFSFGAFVRDYLRAGEGAAMLALASDDTAADLADFDEAGLWAYNPSGFERDVVREDGETHQVGFSMAHVGYAGLPDIAFFTCHNHNPDEFFFTDLERHENTATAIESLVIVSEDPADHHEFLTHVTGQHDIRSSGLGLWFPLGTAKLEVISPVAYRAFFGEAPAPMVGRLAAIRFVADAMDAVLALLQSRSLRHLSLGDALVVPSGHAHGISIAFVPQAGT